MILDILFALYIALLALATWILWPRTQAPVGWCRWCRCLIYEPYADHYEHCNPWNEHVSRCVVRAREAYRGRFITTKCDGQRIEADRDGVRVYDSKGKLVSLKQFKENDNALRKILT